MTIDPEECRAVVNSRANPLLFVLFVARCLSAAHAVLAEEALHSTLGVNNLLSAGVKGVISRPNIYVQFWLGRANSHNNLTVAVNFSVWIPLGVNIRFSHCSFCGESIQIITFSFQLGLGSRDQGKNNYWLLINPQCPMPHAQCPNV